MPVRVHVSEKRGPRKLARVAANESTSPASAKVHHFVSVDPARQFQRVLGIGYSFEHSSCHNLLQLSEADRRHALELMCHPDRGAGMNLWRLCIGTSDFTGTDWYSYDDMPPGQQDPALAHFSIARDEDLVLPVARAALDVNPEILFFASPWSPPGWMKDTGTMLGGRLLRRYYPAYADYLVQFVQAYARAGIPIHAITVQNEPGHGSTKMPTCRWTAGEERDFIRDHLGPAFERAGLRDATEIWCYDHNFGFLRRPSRHPDVVLSDPGTARHVAGVAWHHYGGKPAHVTAFHVRHPATPNYFTEGSVFGLRGGRKIATYFKNWLASYNGWVPFIDTERGPNNGPFFYTRTLLQLRVPERTIKINYDYHVVAHYAKFVRRGARRVFSEGHGKRAVTEVAFRNPDGDLVVVLTNRRWRPTTVRVQADPRVGVQKPGVTPSVTVQVPRRAMATLVWTRES